MSDATNLARAVASAGGVQNMQDDFELRPRKSKVMAQTTWVAVHELCICVEILRSSNAPHSWAECSQWMQVKGSYNKILATTRRNSGEDGIKSP